MFRKPLRLFLTATGGPRSKVQAVVLAQYQEAPFFPLRLQKLVVGNKKRIDSKVTLRLEEGRRLLQGGVVIIAQNPPETL